VVFTSEGIVLFLFQNTVSSKIILQKVKKAAINSISNSRGNNNSLIIIYLYLEFMEKLSTPFMRLSEIVNGTQNNPFCL
jgi:hypothetical protein